MHTKFLSENLYERGH